jgi:hypothetical protein
MFAFFAGLCESFLMWLFLWSGGKLWPVVDVYAPGNRKDRPVKAIIFAEDQGTLNAILRGWTNPDSD